MMKKLFLMEQTCVREPRSASITEKKKNRTLLLSGFDACMSEDSRFIRPCKLTLRDEGTCLVGAKCVVRTRVAWHKLCPVGWSIAFLYDKNVSCVMPVCTADRRAHAQPEQRSRARPRRRSVPGRGSRARAVLNAHDSSP
jgi:hypothetical protein